ncbi:MAG: hypothetical protein AB1420_07110 [Bacillota bacterium]
MKSYIRLKVKHLFHGAALALVILFLLYILLPSLVMNIAEGYYHSGDHLAAKVYYDRIDHYFPKHRKTPLALERAAQISASENLLMVSPMGIGGAYNVGGNLSMEAQKYYKKLAERFPDTFQGQRAVMELTILEIKNLIADGQVEKVFYVVNDYYENLNKSNWDSQVAMETAKALRTKGFFSEAIMVLEDFLAKNEEVAFPDLYELLGDLNGARGNKEVALNYYQRTLAVHEDNIRRSAEHLDDKMMQGSWAYFEEKKEWINWKIANLSVDPAQAGVVQGTVTLTGVPLKDVQVFLQPLRHEDRGGFPVGSHDAIWATSDAKGHFYFKDVQPGRYGF